jgi:RNA polymerase II subunit A C-terminal domain phosphatase
MATTPLYLPDTLPYPIRIATIDSPVSASLSRGARLLTYSYTFVPKPDPDGKTSPNETRFGTWDMPVEGTIDRWNFRKGQTVFAQMADETPAVIVKEACTHDVQAFGLCALCGKDMTK